MKATRTPTVRMRLAGSRPISTQAASRAALASAIRGAVGRPAQAPFHESANRAVSDSIRGFIPATRIGSSGRAGGNRAASRVDVQRPSNVERPVRMSELMIVSASSNRLTLWSVG